MFGMHGGSPVSLSEPVSVPVLVVPPGGVVVLDSVLLALAETPIVVSPELASTVVVPSPDVVLPLLTVDVALVELVGGSTVVSGSTVDCDAESVADPPSVGVVVLDVVAVAPLVSGPRLV